MSAIITDNIRILNAKNFVASLESTSNSYYSFIGLPNSQDYDENWDNFPIPPKDSFDEINEVWETIIALKKISNDDIRQVVRKIQWISGDSYDMYRHDISRNHVSNVTERTSLYASNFYVVNEDFRVYICLQNGTTPEYPNGRPSLDQPTFTDLEPRSAGTSGDGYIWKYLYTIKPSDAIKFDSVDYIPAPRDWETNPSNESVRKNSSKSGQLKIATIVSRGFNLGPARSYIVPINGDGKGAEATVIVGNDSRIESITIRNGGSGYTYATLDLVAASFPVATGSQAPKFDVIIPPPGGHGADIYKELGATSVLVYSRIENDTESPDFITGNQIARIGIIENPLNYDSTSLLTIDKVSAVSALKLVGIANTNDYQTAKFEPDSEIFQNIGFGITAVGRVISYDNRTGVLKYWQDRGLYGFNYGGEFNSERERKGKTIPTYGYKANEFTIDPDGGDLIIRDGSVNLRIDTNFSGISTTINNITYILGQEFISGMSNPEIKKYSGNIIFIDNRPSITRSINQKEDIKVILQF
jgi:hypothetical protein